MSRLLSVEQLVEIHNKVVEEAGAESGYRASGLLQSIVEAPDRGFQGKELCNTISKKASVMMEAIIRLHPFTDRNKRTSLFALVKFIEMNDHIALLPLDAVRETVRIALVMDQDENSNELLINRIDKWIRGYVVTKNSRPKERLPMLLRWYCKMLEFYLPYRLGFKKYSYKVIARWFAFDVYPLYAISAKGISNMLLQSVKSNLALLGRLE